MTRKQAQAIDLSFLRDRKAQKRMVAVTLVFALGGLAYALLAPRWYRAGLTIVPAAPPKSAGLSSLLGGELGGLAAGLGAIGGGSVDAARIVAVLQSNAVTDAAIDKFDLMARYGDRYRETAREDVWRHCDAKALSKPNLVQLSCEDTSPKFAQELLSFLAEYGNQAFRRVSRSTASEEVRFLEARAVELRKQADETAAKVREFQETHRLVDLDAQAKAVVSEVAVLTGQRIGKQMELEYARTFSSHDEATTRQLESQLSVVDETLLDLEDQRPPTSRGGKTGLFPPALTVPKLRAEYEKLYRDRKVVEMTLVYVLQQLEGARASEVREVSTFQVLDPPSLPTRKARPIGTLAVALGTLLGLAVSLAAEWWRAIGRETLGPRIRAGLARSPEGKGTSTSE
jgi:uncharacterized protein involved in exopolysaccharide biosynthesis